MVRAWEGKPKAKQRNAPGNPLERAWEANGVESLSKVRESSALDNFWELLTAHFQTTFGRDIWKGLCRAILMLMNFDGTVTVTATGIAMKFELENKNGIVLIGSMIICHRCGLAKSWSFYHDNVVLVVKPIRLEPIQVGYVLQPIQVGYILVPRRCRGTTPRRVWLFVKSRAIPRRCRPTGFSAPRCRSVFRKGSRSWK